MSSELSPLLPPNVAHTFAQPQSSEIIAVAALTILYYDYILTLLDEIDRYWPPRRLSWASSFFYLNRYLVLLGHCPIALAFFWSSTSVNRVHTCLHLWNYRFYLLLLIQIVIGVLLIMRVYALYRHNKWILGALCCIAIFVIVFSALEGANKLTANVSGLPPMGCLIPTSQKEATKIANGLTSLLAFDVIIFGLTAYKSWTRNPMGSDILLHILFRDGAIYFGVVALANIAVIIALRLASPYHKTGLTTATNILSSIVISRIMLNLRDPKLLTDTQSNSSTSIEVSELIFAAVIDIVPSERIGIDDAEP